MGLFWQLGRKKMRRMRGTTKSEAVKSESMAGHFRSSKGGGGGSGSIKRKQRARETLAPEGTVFLEPALHPACAW